MMPDSLATFASFNQEITLSNSLGCFWFFLGPYLLIAVAFRSFLSPKPLWPGLLALYALGIAPLVYYCITISFPSGFVRISWIVSWGTILLAPAVAVREGFKRNWFRKNRGRRPLRRDLDLD